MRSIPTDLRVFEEDGPTSAGSPTQALSGGHGGRAGLLQPGDERSIVFDPGPGRFVLETWVSSELGPARLKVKQGPRRLPGADQLVPAPAGTPGHWVRLGTISALDNASLDQRTVIATWTADPSGGRIDALRLRRKGG